ncbi:ABC transporter permease [Adhaeribacter aerolatus]|uniref:ABC transporter permease n=1 Tax=Adhaeribacter aerolatus TaxID=670289 RepID=A0A512ASP5_9BACT|nr:HlyD family efflux transporter periplasmic adaptor subunit [Adhaeribacter aerolatus]GEO02733.1 ABC transporter permease [Adhaeribacter aerolatus]
MDRELSEAKIKQNKRKAYGKIGLVALVVLLAIMGLRLVLKPTVSKATINTAIATLGPIEATITASGVIVPETEEIISSPIPARIQKVLRQSGEKIKTGESVLQLDKESTLTSFNKLKDEQQLKQNKASKLRIELQRDLNDLQAQYNIKKMRVKSLESVVADERYLLKIGGGTPENTRQAELNLQVAQLELKLLQDQIQNKKVAMQADLKELGFEMDMQARDIEELQRTINQAEVTANRNGVVTWVNTEIGAAVNKGDIVARVADLNSFKVKASIADAYADQLRPGGPVIVRVNDTDLRGTISTIEPAVANGIVTFFVQLDYKNHALLRPSLRVEVYAITSFKDKVVRVKNGPFYNGAHDQAVFVVQGDKAVRRTVQIGESNFDFVELKDKIAPGEEVIVSDMKEYSHLSEINLKN